MSNGDQHGYITFGWIATIVGALLLSAMWKSNITSENQSSYYAEKCAQKYPDSPIGSAFTSAAESKAPASQGDKEKEDKTDWCDLAAQQSVAEDTAGVHYAAWVALLFTIVGVFLVWTTFNATREANVIARAIGENQVRAYLFVESAAIHVLGHSIDVFPVIKNTGLSPARNVIIKTSMGAVVSGEKVGTKEFISYESKGIEITEWLNVIPSSAAATTKITSWSAGNLGMNELPYIIGGAFKSAIIVANGLIEWVDIFDNRQIINFSIVSKPFVFDGVKLAGVGEVTHSDHEQKTG